MHLNKEIPEETLPKGTGSCEFGRCNHGPEDHDEGLCWKITQPDEEGNEKYCGCNFGGETHRRYDRLGEQWIEAEDLLITKKCQGCSLDLLLRIDNNYCGACKSRV